MCGGRWLGNPTTANDVWIKDVEISSLLNGGRRCLHKLVLVEEPTKGPITGVVMWILSQRSSESPQVPVEEITFPHFPLIDQQPNHARPPPPLLPSSVSELNERF